MSLPGFDEIGPKTAIELRIHIADRVRLERRKMGLSQEAFAKKCDIPLRTFKRFEQGRCDSMEVFLRIAILFDRISAFELMFPSKPAVMLKARSASVMLEELRKRVEEKSKN